MNSFSQFLSLLSDVADPRRREGKIYKLPYVLLFSILAIVAGANSYRSIHTFIETHLDRLNEAFGLSWKRAPAYTAIRYILRGLDPASVEQAFRKHAGLLQLAARKLEAAKAKEEREEDKQEKAGANVIAIDGKTLKHSFDAFHDQKAAHILNAFVTDSALILAHAEVDDKSNEIPAAQDLMSKLNLAESIVTLDAMHCQKTFEAAAKAGAHLIVQVKDNQPILRETAEAVAAKAEPLEVDATRSRGHNRDEIREVAVFDAHSAVAQSEWRNHVAAVITVKRTVHKRNSKTGLWDTTTEKAFYLSSQMASASVCAHAIRGHWGIENRNHYPRDVTFCEDASRIRDNPGIFARLRSFAYNILRINKSDSFTQQRFRAALGGVEGLLALTVI